MRALIAILVALLATTANAEEYTIRDGRVISSTVSPDKPLPHPNQNATARLVFFCKNDSGEPTSLTFLEFSMVPQFQGISGDSYEDGEIVNNFTLSVLQKPEDGGGWFVLAAIRHPIRKQLMILGNINGDYDAVKNFRQYRNISIGIWHVGGVRSWEFHPSKAPACPGKE